MQNLNTTMRLMVAGLALTLTACVTTTPYQPQDRRGFGFSEQRLQEQRFRVRFSGNTATPRETVENYLLYRAAEITLENGATHFRFVDREVDKDERQRQQFVTGVGFGFGGWGRPGFGNAILIDSGPALRQFNAHADIILVREPNPADPDLFDAAELKRNLEPLIQRPAAG